MAFEFFDMKTCLKRFMGLAGLIAIAAASALAETAAQPIVFADQGSAWTPEKRAAFYVEDQGSRLIPYAWYKALRQADGMPFGDGALTRYGYLANPSAPERPDLPIGFSVADSAQGPSVGITCAACHTRDILVGSTTYRIDGAPAFADFQPFIVDLDAAVLRVLASGQAFESFAASVLGPEAKPEAVRALHEAVSLWSLRFHTLISQSVPLDKPWGPARLDAIAMIYNHLNGLDLGPAPTYILDGNMAIADAPVRYPFLWNSARQDKTQWGGWAPNGTPQLALGRNFGELVGVFALFHPKPKDAATPLDHDYLSVNSANLSGLALTEAAMAELRPPIWPFAVDRTLAAQGEAIFNRPAEKGGCVDCHGISEGEPRPPNPNPWRTPTVDAGTDIHQWQIVLRSARTGALEGAVVPGVVGPLKANDLSLNVLKAAVTGTLGQLQSANAPPAEHAAPPAPDAKENGKQQRSGPIADPATVPVQAQGDVKVPDGLGSKSAPPDAPPGTFVYEARVLQGIWAAAPYLHNGSVPTLAELLKPSAQRVKIFELGPAYDIQNVGLAREQPTHFTLTTTGCEDRASGNSNCGHDYGTELPDAEKAALIEYLKTL